MLAWLLIFIKMCFGLFLYLTDYPITSLCFSSTTEDIHTQGLALNSTFIYFSKTWLSEIMSIEDCLKDMSLFITLYSKTYACQALEDCIHGAQYFSSLKKCLTELNFSSISSALIEKHHKKQFSVYYHIHYKSRHARKLNIIYPYHWTFLLWESTKVLRKRTTSFTHFLKLTDLTILTYLSPSFLWLLGSSVKW